MDSTYKADLVRIDGRKVGLVKPLTYMNRSGMAVERFFEKVMRPETDRLLVICDDLDLNPGSLRIRGRGRHGGHKGLMSVMDSLEAENFVRMRCGIGRPKDRSITDYVLSPFSRHERPLMKKTIKDAADAVLYLVKNDIQSTMNRFNRSV